MKLILCWHMIFMILKVLDERKLQSATEQKRNIRTIIGAVFGIPSAIVVLLTPILSWFNFSVTFLDTSFWTIRYLILLPYILFNVMTSVLPHLKNFVFLMTDGVLLS